MKGFALGCARVLHCGIPPNTAKPTFYFHELRSFSTITVILYISVLLYVDQKNVARNKTKFNSFSFTATASSDQVHRFKLLASLSDWFRKCYPTALDQKSHFSFLDTALFVQHSRFFCGLNFKNS